MATDFTQTPSHKLATLNQGCGTCVFSFLGYWVSLPAHSLLPSLYKGRRLLDLKQGDEKKRTRERTGLRLSEPGSKTNSLILYCTVVLSAINGRTRALPAPAAPAPSAQPRGARRSILREQSLHTQAALEGIRPFLTPKKVWLGSRRPSKERLYPFLQGKPTGQGGKTKTGRDILRIVTNSIQRPAVVEKRQEQLRKHSNNSEL